MEAPDKKAEPPPPPPPPEPKLDEAFWTGLVQSHRQLGEKKRTERFKSFRLT